MTSAERKKETVLLGATLANGSGHDSWFITPHDLGLGGDYACDAVGVGERLTMDDQLTPLAASGLKLPAGAGRYSGTLIGKLAHQTAGADLEPAPLDVAFVNLMPDTAFLDAEEQFLGLAWDAAWQIGVPLRLWRFWIRGMHRGDEVMRRISSPIWKLKP